jgi:hypothetical protein
MGSNGACHRLIFTKRAIADETVASDALCVQGGVEYTFGVTGDLVPVVLFFHCFAPVRVPLGASPGDQAKLLCVANATRPLLFAVARSKKGQ